MFITNLISFRISVIKEGAMVNKSLMKNINDVLAPKGGVKPAFSKYHIYLALTKLVFEGPLGRKQLSHMLGIGEGSVRTLIRRLLNAKLVITDPVAGVILTKEGLELAKYLVSRIIIVGDKEIDHNELCSNCKISLIVLRNGMKIIEKAGGVLYVRDLIVKKGGNGGLILYYIDNELKMPDTESLYPVSKSRLWEDLLKEHRLGNGDCILASLCHRDDRDCMKYVVEAALDIIEVFENE